MKKVVLVVVLLALAVFMIFSEHVFLAVVLALVALAVTLMT